MGPGARVAAPEAACIVEALVAVGGGALETGATATAAILGAEAVAAVAVLVRVALQRGLGVRDSESLAVGVMGVDLLADRLHVAVVDEGGDDLHDQVEVVFRALHGDLRLDGALQVLVLVDDDLDEPPAQLGLGHAALHREHLRELVDGGYDGVEVGHVERREAVAPQRLEEVADDLLRLVRLLWEVGVEVLEEGDAVGVGLGEPSVARLAVDEVVGDLAG